MNKDSLLHIVYPYNEILPTQKAHDVFIFNECFHFALSGFNTTLLCGTGSEKNLFSHYQTTSHPRFFIKTLPILRRNNIFRINANLPFYLFTQRVLQKHKPNIVIFSVLKQAHFHLQHKIPGIKYIYEAHELAYYPDSPFIEKRVAIEKAVFQAANLIVTTTDELTNIIKNAPYGYPEKVHTIPLAVNVASLPTPQFPQKTFNLVYVGQLYKSQGVALLLTSLSYLPSHVRLKILGGKKEDIALLKELSTKLMISDRVEFLGFKSPAVLSSFLEDSHVFVAPFIAEGKMLHVAHTKLMEYADWKRPVIAPLLKVVTECFPHNRGVVYFQHNDPKDLAKAIKNTEDRYETLVQEISLEKRFTWTGRIDKYASILQEISS